MAPSILTPIYMIMYPGAPSTRPSPFDLIRSGFEDLLFLSPDQVEKRSQGPRLARSSLFDLQGPLFHTHMRCHRIAFKFGHMVLDTRT
jgi:hypothetical protein